jgi:hypothetical protein
MELNLNSVRVVEKKSCFYEAFYEATSCAHMHDLKKRICLKRDKKYSESFCPIFELVVLICMTLKGIKSIVELNLNSVRVVEKKSCFLRGNLLCTYA